MTTTKTPQVTRTSEEPGMSLRTVWWFMALTFAMGWGVMSTLVLFTDQIEAIFGEVSGTNPVFILGVWTPAIAGIILVWRHHGQKGVASYLQRLTLWKMPSPWWLFLLLGIPAVKYLGAAFNGTAGDFPFSPWYGLLPALGIALIIGPVEEIGWRGFALPLLQRKLAPLWAGLILGVFWGLWHAPAFLLSGSPQSAWSFAPYVLGVLALSVIVTPYFNAAQGSILMAALFHFQVNGPAWPDAQPWENYLFAAVAIVMVVLNRKTMFTRTNAVTDVLMPDTGADVTEPRTEKTPV